MHSRVLTHTLPPHPPSHLHTPQLEVYKGDIQRLHRKMERLTSREAPRDGVSVVSQGGADGDTRSTGEQCMEVPVPSINIHTITSSHDTHPHCTLAPSNCTHITSYTPSHSQGTHPHIIHTHTSYTPSHSQGTHPHIIHTLTSYTPHHTPLHMHMFIIPLKLPG